MDLAKRLGLAALGIGLGTSASLADEPPTLRRVPRSAPTASARLTLPENPSSPPPLARFEGSGRPGSRIRLVAQPPASEGRVRWVQVAGSPVALDDPESPSASFTMPGSSQPLEFVLIAGTAAHVKTDRLIVPVEAQSVEAPTRSPAPATSSESLPIADAGDDQVGLIGHRITLNGAQSQPRDGVGYRWIQTQGPAISSSNQDGYIFSFTPDAAGLYRFALVVAQGGRISQPDSVDVLVGTAPPASSAYTSPAYSPSATRPAPAFSPQYPSPSGPEQIQAQARSALLSIPGGPTLAAPLAETFDAIAGRIDLYSSYADVFREMSMRLNPIIPQDPAQRAVWVERLFTPLTARLVERLRTEGLDLTRAEGQSAPLSASQKAALAEIYQAAAAGFRAIASAMPAQP